MANVVDFSQLNQRVTPGLDFLDPITEELHRRNAEAQAVRMQELRDKPEAAREERRVRIQEEQTRHNRANENATRLKTEGEATIKEGDRRAGTEQKIRDAVARGDLDVAEQLGASYQSFNPQTGSVSKGVPGFSINRGIEPPLPSADSADTTPEEDAAVKEWQARQKDPDITIAGVHTTPDKLRYSAARANAADMQKSEDVLRSQLATAMGTHDTATANQLQRQIADLQVRRSQVESGIVKPGEAVKGNDTVAQNERKYGAGMEQTDAKGRTARDVAGINAQGRIDAAQAGAGARSAEKDKERASGTSEKAYARVQADLSTFDRQHNISKDRTEESRMATLLNNKDVTIVQRAMAGNLARGIGSERGVLTDKDITRLQGHLGGYWSDVENWFSKGATGDLSDDVKAKLVEGVQVVLAEKQKDRLAAEKAYERRFLNPTYVGHRWGFSDELSNAFEEKFGHPYQPSAAPSGSAPASARRDPSNPDDQNAPDANRPLDGEDAGPPPPPGRISREDAIREARRRGLIK